MNDEERDARTSREDYESEQKPVACVQDLDEVKRKHLVYEKGMDWKDPLYTSPPKREWVGLTAEEIRLDAHNADSGDWNDDRYQKFWHEGFKEGARGAESMLKEKNFE